MLKRPGAKLIAAADNLTLVLMPSLQGQERVSVVMNERRVREQSDAVQTNI